MLGAFDEVGRRHQAPARMLPAQQGLEAGGLVLVGANKRLEEQLQFVVSQGVAQIQLKGAALLGPDVHGGLEEAIGPATVTLGAIEGEVGVLQQAVGIAGVLRCDGDADAGADQHVVAAHVVALGQALDDGLGQVAQRLGAGRGGHDDGELVAAQTGHQARVANALAQAGGGLDQEVVADRMAQAVVDALEMVEVQAQHRAAGAPLLLAFGRLAVVGEGLAQGLQERQAVGQLGEDVIVGQARDAGLILAGLGDVCAHAPEADEGAVQVVDRLGRERPPVAFAAHADRDDHVTEGLLFTEQGRERGDLAGQPLGGAAKLRQRTADQGVLVGAGCGGHAVGDVGHGAIRVDLPQPVAGAFLEVAE